MTNQANLPPAPRRGPRFTRILQESAKPLKRERIIVILLLMIAAVLSLVTVVLMMTRPAQPEISLTSLAVPTQFMTEVPLVPSVPVPTIVPPTVTATPIPLPTAVPLPIVLAEPTPDMLFYAELEPLGYSTENRPLRLYRVGMGPIKRALIGAIHGGYEWNTVDLMTETLQYLREHPKMVPPAITLYIVPNANPDGYARGTDAVVARMNANGVDLNRNWDYHWQMTATHGTRPVSAGSAPFSEPETRALRDFIEGERLDAVIFYHSAFSAVFQGAVITRSQTAELAQLMAQAIGYRYLPEGVIGQITTGDAIDYLSARGITAVEVELSNHQTTDLEQNLRGLQAFLNWDVPDTGPTPLVSEPLPQLSTGTPAPPVLQHDATITYTVQPGDTLSGIALKYAVDVDALRRLNNRAPEEDIFLRPGEILKIPQS